MNAFNSWLFETSEFAETPSVKDGISPLSEYTTRMRACRYIERCSRQLIIPHNLICTAKILLHRFYMRASLKACEYHEVAAALLFLACKLGEGKSFKKIDLVISVCGTEAKKSKLDPTEHAKEYHRWRDYIMYYEQYALRLLCFDLAPILPHSVALRLLEDIGGSIGLQKHAFFYCDEALCTDLSVRYPAKVLAEAAIYAASMALNETPRFPDGTEWFNHASTSIEKLKVIGYELCFASDENMTGKIYQIRS